jgi:ComF family protein
MSVSLAVRFGSWAADRFVGLVFPADCVGCGAPLGAAGRFGSICAPCRGSFRPLPEPACPRCAEPLGLAGHAPSGDPALPESCRRCAAGAPRFERLRSGGIYEGALRKAILALKFRRHDFLGRHLVDFARGDREAAELVAAADRLVPVPMHRSKERERGGNSAAIIAEAWSRASGRPLSRLLVKGRATAAQSGLSLEERRENVRGSIRLRRFAGKVPHRIVLVDDVATTGATLDECARILLAAGAKRIDAVTIARTLRDGSRTEEEGREPAGGMIVPDTDRESGSGAHLLGDIPNEMADPGPGRTNGRDD